MALGLGQLISVPKRLGLNCISSFMQSLSDCTSGCSTTPPAISDCGPCADRTTTFVRENCAYIGRQVEVTTPGGNVVGILGAVRSDYHVINEGATYALIPHSNIQGIRDLN